MIQGNNSMFANTDLIGMALDATWKRNQVINENIANVDTPGYKRKDVSFESYLEKALETNDSDEISSLKRVSPRVYTENEQLSYRKDGNNVDIDTEMVLLAENQLRYNTMVSQVNYNFERLKAVIK
jgi:flagellar basal-body rod protein FlgB